MYDSTLFSIRMTILFIKICEHLWTSKVRYVLYIHALIDLVYTYVHAYICNTYMFKLFCMCMLMHVSLCILSPLQSVCAQYNRMIYYMRFAMAAYGWRLYAYKNGLRGIINTLSNIWYVNHIFQHTCMTVYICTFSSIISSVMSKYSTCHHNNVPAYLVIKLYIYAVYTQHQLCIHMYTIIALVV